MLAAKFRNALGKAWSKSIRMFSRLRTSVTRAGVSDAARRLEKQTQRTERQRHRIQAQRRKIEAQSRKIKTLERSSKAQAKRIEAQSRKIKTLERSSKAQARRIEVYEQRYERIIKLLSEKDLQRARWEAGKSYEVAWWRKWFRKNRHEQTDDYKRRFDPDQPLQERITQHLSAPPGATISILDVGAGPVTRLGKRWGGRTVHMTAIDPLADEYNLLLDEFGLTPPVRTQEGEAEQLSKLFPAESFDLVNIENALDHSYDPLVGIRQMLAVVKRGGWVVLYHNVDEGDRGGYLGFHQWNFRAENGRFVMWNPQTRVYLDEALSDEAEVTAETLYEVEVYFPDLAPRKEEKVLVGIKKV